MGRLIGCFEGDHFPPDSRPLLIPLDSFRPPDTGSEAPGTGVEQGDMALDDSCTGKGPGDTALGNDSCSWLSVICTV